MRPLTWPFDELINEIKVLKDAYQVFVKIFNDVFPYFKQSKLQPGQMHFFPSRLGLGLLEPAKAEFEVLFIIILSHLVNITPSSFTLIH